jgi:hypothetical protein
MGARDLERIAGGRVALQWHEALVEEITAALPEARGIQRIIDDHTARVVTFELLSIEER